MAKYNLRKDGLILANSLRKRPVMVEKAWHQETAGYLTPTVWKQKAKDDALSSLSPLYTTPDPSLPPTLRKGFPTLTNPISGQYEMVHL